MQKQFRPLKTKGCWTLLENRAKDAIEKFRVVRSYEPESGIWSSGTGRTGLISAVSHFIREVERKA